MGTLPHGYIVDWLDRNGLTAEPVSWKYPIHCRGPFPVQLCPVSLLPVWFFSTILLSLATARRLQFSPAYWHSLPTFFWAGPFITFTPKTSRVIALENPCSQFQEAVNFPLLFLLWKGVFHKQAVTTEAREGVHDDSPRPWTYQDFSRVLIQICTWTSSPLRFPGHWAWLYTASPGSLQAFHWQWWWRPNRFWIATDPEFRHYSVLHFWILTSLMISTRSSKIHQIQS